MRRILPFVLPLAGFATAAVAAPGFTIGGEAFPQTDIVDARAMPDMQGNAAIMLTLSPAAAGRLARVTGANVGKTVPVELDGTLLFTPLIMTAVEGGVLELGGDTPVAEAEAIARRISGRDPLPDSLDQ